MNNYNNGYLSIKNKAIIELKAHLFRIYSYLLSKDYNGTGVFYGQAKMSEELGISIRTLQRHIKELKELGFLKVRRRGFNMTNLYTMLKHIVTSTKEKVEELKENFSRKFATEKKVNTFVDYCQDPSYKNEEYYQDIEKKLLEGAVQIIGVLADGIIQVAPLLLEAGLQLIVTLGQGLASGLPQMIPTIVDLIVSMCDKFIENLPMFLDVAIEIILALVEGLVGALPTLIQEIPRIINSFCNAIYEKLPDILKAGIEIIVMLVKGLIDSIPVILENLPQIIMAIVNVFTMMNWASIGKNLVTNIGSGISSMVSNIGTIAKNLGTNVVEAIKGIFTSNGSGIGRNLISFISNGISSMLSGIVTVAKSIGTSVVNVFKNMFSISNMADIGRKLIKGIWNGISNMTGWILNKIGGFADSVVSSIKSFFGIGRSISSSKSIKSSGSVQSLYNTESLLNARALSLDNVALSGSYYTATTRDSLNANNMIRQVNGLSNGTSATNQSDTLDNITKQFTQEIANMKAENNSMMNALVTTLNTMTKAMQEYVLQDHIELKNVINLNADINADGQKIANVTAKYMGKAMNRYEKLAMR